MKVLFIGGNGNISWYCVQEAINQGHEVWILHRGVTTGTRRDIQPEVKIIHADYRNDAQVKDALYGYHFDVVIDFICYNEGQAKFDVECFTSYRTDHFIFISTGSVYERGTRNLPYNEDSPRCIDPIREYTRNKIKAEDVFMNAWKRSGFPVTIIRPGYTYDTIIPVSCGLNDGTVCKRILEGKPPIILGDGSSIYTFTHSRDFANALVLLFGVLLDGGGWTTGEVYNITSDERLNWKEATDILVDALGAKRMDYIYIPTEYVCRYLEQFPVIRTGKKLTFNPSLEHSLSHMASDFRSQKQWCDLYDNSKIKAFTGWEPKITLEEGLRETIAWMNEKEERKRVDPNLNGILNELTERWAR